MSNENMFEDSLWHIPWSVTTDCETLTSTDIVSEYKNIASFIQSSKKPWLSWTWRKEEEPNMNIHTEEFHGRPDKRTYCVSCEDSSDLSQDHILRSIEIMKAKLLMQISPVKVKQIECKMTPKVKDAIITAVRKLDMYGKTRPFIARFDEYGRRLPDEIKFDTMRGMLIEIMDPDIHGEYHLEFRRYCQ